VAAEDCGDGSAPRGPSRVARQLEIALFKRALADLQTFQIDSEPGCPIKEHPHGLSGVLGGQLDRPVA